MKRLESLADLDGWRRSLAGGPLGLVPTMGSLHEGHLSLVRRSVEENPCTLATIFVNPAQFDDADDLAAYPRQPEADAAALTAVGCDALFAPPAEEIYPPGFQTFVEVGDVARPLEGAARPGHFRGVATVVLKLFHLTRPDRAYFGDKDFQQVVVVETMTRDLGLPIEIVRCPTVREEDGLAMSSRNRRLAPRQRSAAAVLPRALRAAERAWREGERRPGRLRSRVEEVLAAEPLARVDYVSAADPRSLRELDGSEARDDILLSLAVRFGGVRLIDNLRLTASAGEDV